MFKKLTCSIYIFINIYIHYWAQWGEVSTQDYNLVTMGPSLMILDELIQW